MAASISAGGGGFTRRAGLDVVINQGGPQLNSLQLLAGGEADVLMSDDIQVLNAYAGRAGQGDLHLVPVRLVALARPEVPSLDELKGHKIYMGNSGFSTYWPWLKRRYGYTDDIAGPKGTNLQTFVNDPTSAVAGYITSEPYVAKQNNVPRLLPVRGLRLSLLLQHHGDHRGLPPREPRCGRALHPRLGRRLAELSARSLRRQRLIKHKNPRMDDDQLAYGLQKIREVKAVDGGDAATMGIGTHAERWQKTRDFLVDVNLLRAQPMSMDRGLHHRLRQGPEDHDVSGVMAFIEVRHGPGPKILARILGTELLNFAQTPRRLAVTPCPL